MGYCLGRMTDVTPIAGELQGQIMAVLWRFESGTVEEVRGGLPPRYHGAYTTVQTVLNRLAERGMLKRRKRGNAIEYHPTMTEAEYLAGAIRQTLATASSDARQAALAELLGSLKGDELSKLQERASTIERGRKRP